MDGTISQHLDGLAGETQRKAIRVPMRAIGERLSTQCIKVAALRIKGGSASALVQTNATSVHTVIGKLVTKATAQDFPALVGTVVNATFNIFAFFIDVTGTLTTVMGIAATTLQNVQFPPQSGSKALVGFVIINPTGTGNFVGGTTVLDDATVVPNAVFVDTNSCFDPTILA